MKTLFSAKTYLRVALALAALATAGTVPALAQARDHTGSMMPFYYDSTGGQVTGSWSAAAPITIGQHTAQSSQHLYLSARRSSRH
jgi:hypothetical protein